MGISQDIAKGLLGLSRGLGETVFYEHWGQNITFSPRGLVRIADNPSDIGQAGYPDLTLTIPIIEFVSGRFPVRFDLVTRISQEYAVTGIYILNQGGMKSGYRLNLTHIPSGDTPIFLIEPTSTSEDFWGQNIETDHNSHSALVIRKDERGTEEIDEDVERYSKFTRWDVRSSSNLDGLSPSWRLQQGGDVYDIEAVLESRRLGPHQKHIFTRRSGGVE